MRGGLFAEDLAATLSVFLYGIYAAAGLQLLVFSCFSGDWRSDCYFISFKGSVCCLALANICHSISIFGVIETTIATCGLLFIVLFFEELGLSTGYVFGDYMFTDELGWFISPNLPALVPVLWGDVIYPAFLMASMVLSCNYRFVNRSSIFYCVVKVTVASAILTGFDVMCEPISTSFGHKIWHHLAFVSKDIGTYVRMPDWTFHEISRRFSFLGIPIHNTIGWYFVGSVCYSWMIYVHELRHGSSAGLRGPTWWKVSWYTALPPAVALECTSCFYALFPAHPFAVKAVSMVYLSLVFGLAVVVYKSTKTKIARCK